MLSNLWSSMVNLVTIHCGHSYNTAHSTEASEPDRLAGEGGGMVRHMVGLL